MRIGLISDTHDNLPLVERAVECFNDARVSRVFHAGDYVAPFVARPLSKLAMPMTGVFGNNDGEKNGWYRAIKGLGDLHDGPYETVIGGMTFLLMHEPEGLETLAASGKYDIIVYGHTHLPDERREGKTLIVNPGECGGWLTGRSSVALLDLPSKELTFIDL